MDPFRPALAALPPAIPIFPLTGALLLPGGRLPLNIFEPRFLAMVEDALAGGRMLGMVLPDPAFPRLHGRSTVYRVGCLGRIASFSETEDGRYLITLLGLIRFAVREELPETGRAVRRLRVDYAPYAADLEEAEEPVLDRAALVAALRPYFRSRGIEAEWDAIEAAPMPGLVTSLCMICPFEDREKQALLEAPDLEQRLAALVALLQMEAAGAMGPGQAS
jgi:Lon protease-like protein